MKVEPSGLSVLTTVEVTPLVASIVAGGERIKVPSVAILASEPFGPFTFAPVFPEATPTVMSPSVLMFVVRIAPLLSDIKTLREASLFILTSAPIGTFTLDSVVPLSVFTVLYTVPSFFMSMSSSVVPETSLSVFEPSVFVVSASKVISFGYFGLIAPVTPATAETSLTGLIVTEVEP